MTPVAEQVQTAAPQRSQAKRALKREPITEEVLNHHIPIIMAMAGHPFNNFRVTEDRQERRLFYEEAKIAAVNAFGTTYGLVSYLITLGAQKNGVDGPIRIRNYILDNFATAEEKARLDHRVHIS